jgi:hypothetical protein
MMSVELMDALWVILVITVATMILSPVLWWLLAHKPGIV